MTTLKRPFATLQDLDPAINLSIPTSKKIKPNYEHPLKLIARVKASSNNPNEPKSSSNEAFNIDVLDSSITISRPEGAPGSKDGATTQKFSFARIFEQEATQQEVMKSTISPLLDDVLNNGKAGLVMCHGSSIADKAYTLIGNSTSPGMIPRIMRVLLDMRIKIMQGLSDEMIGFSSQDGENNVVDFKVQFEAYEIYNEEIYDLLKENKKDKMQQGIQSKQRLQLKEKDSQRVFIKDLSSVDLSTETQAAQALARCRSHFEEDANFINERSATSHTILKFTVKQTFKSNTQNALTAVNRGSAKQITNSSLCFVNLAGSERPRKTDLSDPQSKREVLNTSNKSLTVLSRCFRDLRELREGQNTHTMGSTWTSTSLGKAPIYKESKLTRLMYEYFSDDSNLRFITHLSPDVADLEDTFKLLNYSGQLKGVNAQTSNATSVPKTANALKNNNTQNFGNNSAPKGILQDSTNLNSHNNNNVTNISSMIIEEKPMMVQEIKSAAVEENANAMNLEEEEEAIQVMNRENTEPLPEPEPIVLQPIDLISFDQLKPQVIQESQGQQAQVMQEEIVEEPQRNEDPIDLLQKVTEPTTPIKVSREDFPVLITYPEIDTKKALPKKSVTPIKNRGVTPNKNPLTPNRTPVRNNPLTPVRNNNNPLTPNRNPLTPNRLPIVQQNKPVVAQKKEVVMPKTSAWLPMGNEKTEKSGKKSEKKENKMSKKKATGNKSKPGTAAKENQQGLVMDEKDAKIQVLEDLVQKLQEKVLAKQTAEKLDKINEGFKSTFKTMMDVNCNSKAPGEDIPFLANAIKLDEDNKPRESIESISSIESSRTTEGPDGGALPINVNYFVFNGEIKSENIQKLEKLFKANNKNLMNQNQLFVFEQKGGPAIENCGTSSCAKDSVAKTERDILVKQEVIEISDDEGPKVKVEEPEFNQTFSQTKPSSKKRTAQKEREESAARLEESNNKNATFVSAEKRRKTPTTKMEIESVSKSRERSVGKSPSTATRGRKGAVKDSPGLTPIATRTRRRTKGKNE